MADQQVNSETVRPLPELQKREIEDGPARKDGWAAAIVGLVVTLLLAHYPMIFSGFAQTQSDSADGRLNNYFLEHGWNWLTFRSGGGFWDEPFFYPARNVGAYSDLMVSFVPLYGPWRVLGFFPDTAMQLWMMSATAANFAAAYLLLRRQLGCGAIAAAVGAAMFGAAAPRVSQMLHAQLVCAALPVLAIYALYGIFEPVGEENSRAKSRWYIVLFAAAIALQAWGGFYNAFFLVLLLSIAGLFALLVKNCRERMFQVFFQEWWFISVVFVGMVLLMSPMLLHYVSALREQGDRSHQDVLDGLVKPWIWIYPGPFSVPYGMLASRLGVDGDVESAVGCGLLTSIVAIAGLWLHRRREDVRLLAVAGIAAIALTTVFAGRFSLWWLVYHAVPGAGAIRQPSRISIMVLLPISVGVALAVDRLLRRSAGALVTSCAIVLAIACLGEQAVGGLSVSKSEDRQRVAGIVAVIPPGAHCFYYSGPADASEIAQVDGMWASLLSGVPTMNGYSGCAPVHYPLANANATSVADRQDLLSSLEDWTSSHGLDAGGVAWVMGDGGGRLQAATLSAAAKELALPQFPMLALGERVKFNDDKINPYLGDGWSYAEADFRWTDGPRAQIRFSVASPLPHGAVLSLAVQPMLGAMVSVQHVITSLNGHVIQRLNLTEDRMTIAVPIPDEYLKPDNVIELELPDATATKDDNRRLGLAVEWMSLDVAH